MPPLWLSSNSEPRRFSFKKAKTGAPPSVARQPIARASKHLASQQGCATGPQNCQKRRRNRPGSTPSWCTYRLQTARSVFGLSSLYDVGHLRRSFPVDQDGQVLTSYSPGHSEQVSFYSTQIGPPVPELSHLHPFKQWLRIQIFTKLDHFVHDE